MDNNEFIEKIKRINKIKSSDEAFILYPAEEEEHKGELNSYVADDSEAYNATYSIGDIVFVKEYKYKNGRKKKNHLFVIVGEDNLVVPIEYFGMLISSKISKVKYTSNKLLNKDNINKLHTDSIVKTDIIYKINPRAIAFKIGKVDKNKIEEYRESYLNLNNT